MVTALLGTLVVVGLVVVVVMAFVQARQLRSAAPATCGAAMPVSVLKPMKGVDARLEANLETFFRLDYPCYELVFGVSEPADPALEVARRVAGRHPQVAARFVAGGRPVGHNPKVNNLASMLRTARHELLLISDSNVAVGGDYLQVMVDQLEQPGVGLVTSFIRGTAGRGLGGALESLQLNTFVMGGIAAADSLLRRVAAVGKSMLLRRSDLERIGGFAELGRYLAEDQVCGEAIQALGRRVVVSPRPVDNVLGSLSLRGFTSRHLRWARIRRRIAPLGYAAELLANPLPPALLLAALEPGRATAILAATTLGVTSALALGLERRLGIHRRALLYPGLELLRALLVAILWPVPFVSSTVDWRGQRFRVGPRTLLEPLADPPALLPEPEVSEAA